MEQHELFLVQGGYFTFEELDSIRECGNFYCKRDVDEIIVVFNFKNLVSVELLDMIHFNIKKDSKLHADINYEATSNFSMLNKYIINFFKNNNIKLEHTSDFSALVFKLYNGVLSYESDNENDKIISKHKEQLISYFYHYSIVVNDVTFKVINIGKMVEKYHSDILKRNEEQFKKLHQISISKEIHELKNLKCKIFKILERKNIKMPFTWYVHDGTTAHILKAFATTDATRALNQSFSVNDWVEVTAFFEYDAEYEKAIVGQVKAIKKIATPAEAKVVENFSKPRIELFSHTKMSTQDGICSAEDVVEFAREHKAKAVGFADRSNAQSFPEIDDCAKDIKALYGVEINVWNRHIPIVINQINNVPLANHEYVVFDIETTGLNNEHCEMIEFGAIKIKNGITIDKVDWLVKPSMPIPAHITKLTNITDEMVKDCAGIVEVLKKVCEFVGDDILIAHNGINFDLPFLNKMLIKNGMPILTNIMIDTMQLSRAINIKMKRHNLGAICREYGIEYDEDIAHRADYDAQVLNSAWMKMIDQLSSYQIKHVEEINKLCTTSNYYEKQFPTYLQIYAKDQVGLKTLYRLLTTSYTKQTYGEPSLFKDQIDEDRDHLIIASSPYWGDVWDKANNGTDDELRSVISFYDFIFIAPVSSINYLIGTNRIDTESAVKAILRIVTMARKCQKPVVAVSANYYLEKNEQVVHDIYIHAKRIKKGVHPFYTRDVDTPPLLYYRSTQEMLDEFSFISDPDLLNEIVIENTYKFANMCSKIIINRKKLEVPEIEDVDTKIKEVIDLTTYKIYGHKVDKKILERIKTEFGMITSKGYSVIYWISHLLVQKSNNDGFVVGSRGSVGSSLVAYLMNITEVNPLPPHYVCTHCHNHFFVDDETVDGFDLPEMFCPMCKNKMTGNGHNIPFETFLGTPEVVKVPDIDLNFSGEYQPLAHKFIYDMFGKENAFKAGTILTVAEKTAYGFIKDYYEQIGVECPNKAQVEWLRSKCMSVKRASGQHAGGVVIVPKKFDALDFFPYQFPPKADESDWYCTHFPFEHIHDYLLKFDILGHDFPTRYKMMVETSKVAFQTEYYTDKKVITLFTSLDALNIKPTDIDGETIGTYGIPECSTDTSIKMIKDTKPSSFGDLIRISGLSHGTNVWVGNAKDILENDKTLSIRDVICYREDMQLFLASKGVNKDIAFKISESVRKGKGVPKDCYNLLVEKIPQWYIDSCNKIEYLFPKAHATAYMTGSFICGWYKIYYPIHFYGSYFNTKADDFDYPVIMKGKDQIIATLKDIVHRSKAHDAAVSEKEKSHIIPYRLAVEFYARGLKFSKIDINKSDAVKFIIDGDVLIPPFVVIEGCGVEAALSVITARTEKPFTSIQDISKRTKINKTILQKLREYEALGDLSETDQMNIFGFI
ncbi:MAG: PolC-type DNA polymerase III [Mycoplasmataceae bacterium]|nr:PolC-type DNA polymerase III [Mycoplasmataceae bacterium]